MIVSCSFITAILAFASIVSSLNFPQKRQFYDPAAPDRRILKSYKNQTQPSAFKIKDAKHLTLWYNGIKYESQSNQTVVNNDIYYQKLRAGESDYLARNYFTALLADFPVDIAILSLKISILNENEQPTGVADGMYIYDASIISPFLISKNIVECFNSVSWISLFPPVQANAAPAPGPEIFSLRDGSRPNTGLWSPDIRTGPLSENFAVQVIGVNLQNRTRNLGIKVELDYVDGMPEVGSNRKSIFPGKCEEMKLVKDVNGGPKRFKLKPFNSLSVQFDGEILFIEPTISSRGGVEYHVKINGKLVCNSTAQYIELPVNPHQNNTFHTAPVTDIGRMTVCEGPFAVKKNDLIDTEAYFDFEIHPISEAEMKSVITDGLIPGAVKNGAIPTLFKNFMNGESTGIYITYSRDLPKLPPLILAIRYLFKKYGAFYSIESTLPTHVVDPFLWFDENPFMVTKPEAISALTHEEVLVLASPMIELIREFIPREYFPELVAFAARPDVIPKLKDSQLDVHLEIMASTYPTEADIMKFFQKFPELPSRKPLDPLPKTPISVDEFITLAETTSTRPSTRQEFAEILAKIPNSPK